MGLRSGAKDYFPSHSLRPSPASIVLGDGEERRYRLPGWDDMLSHDSIWRAIDALEERHQLSPSGLARRAGLDPTSFNKSKRKSHDGRDRWPSTTCCGASRATPD